MSFDWKAADDAAIDTITDKVVRKRRFTPLALIFLFLLFLGVVGVVYWQVQSRFESIQANTEADVRATYQLVQQALSQRDDELFQQLLATQDSSWVKAQEQRFQKGLLLGRVPFGMQRIATGKGAPGHEVIVRPSPDWQTAEVVSEHLYTVQTQIGVAETITLQLTTHYRQVGNRWLLAPPPENYWGGWAQNEQNLLTVAYPRRDQAIAERLAVDLNAVLAEMCRAVMGVDCPDDFHLQLRLENDPVALSAVDDIHFIVNSRANLSLPTPTLVGLPADEKAYDALRRGYAAQVVTAGITELLDYECCEHGLFYRAYVEKQLAQMGLRPWPLTPVDYKQLSEDGLDYLETATLRGRESLDIPESERWQLVFALVDFLAEEFPPEIVHYSIERGLEPSAMGYSHSYFFVQEWAEFVASQSAQ
jgi:hypothetical protein